MARFPQLFLWLFTPPALAFGGGGAPPPPPAVPPPPPPPPMLQQPQGEAAANEARRRAQAASGFGGTIMTGPEGVSAPAKLDNKQLLGA